MAAARHSRPEVMQVAERSPRVCLPGSLLTHRAGRRLLAQDSAVTAVPAAKALRGRRRRVRALSGVKRLDRHALPFVAGGYNGRGEYRLQNDVWVCSRAGRRLRRGLIGAMMVSSRGATLFSALRLSSLSARSAEC